MTAAQPILDPVKVRQALADLDREREVQAAVVEVLADTLDAAERTLTAIDRRLEALRENSAVREILDGDVEQAIGRHYRRPGPPWTWLESVAGSRIIRRLPSPRDVSVTMELACDDVSGRCYVAPEGTPPPDGGGWTLARVTLP